MVAKSYVSFLDQESLAKHVSTFCNKKRKTRKVFPCSKCDVVLMTDESYQNHLTKIHDNKTEKNLQCERCPKKFATLKGLKSHQKTCGLLFKCHFCAKTFVQFSNLKTHVKLVHEKENLMCDQCDKTFLTSKELESHDNFAHNPNFAFKCAYCETAYTGKYNLKLHYSQKHKLCPICKQEFPTIDEVYEHFKRLHPEFYQYPDSPFAFDSDNILSIKKEIKQEVQDEVSFCKNIKTEDQSVEIEQLRQSYEALKKEHEQSLSDISSFKLEIDLLKNQNESLTQKLSSVQEELKTIKEKKH